MDFAHSAAAWDGQFPLHLKSLQQPNAIKHQIGIDITCTTQFDIL